MFFSPVNAIVTFGSESEGVKGTIRITINAIPEAAEDVVGACEIIIEGSDPVVFDLVAAEPEDLG